MQSVAAPARASSEATYFSITAGYLNRVIPKDKDMKVLLLDHATLPIISMSFSQSALLEKGVFLVDHVSDNRQRNPMKNMSCVVFIRPEESSVYAVCSELQKAKYAGYTIIFCGAASTVYLQQLARADEENLVRQVEEVFCDFCAVNADAFLTELKPSALSSSEITNAQSRRMAEGLAAMFVAQRRRPHIRYDRSSVFASRVVKDLAEILRGDPELYNYRSRDATLLIIDRRSDPVTALLTPWTYQAMLHEHIGLDHNTLKLPSDFRGADPEGYVFSQQDDIFFAANMYLNWGDLCNNVKTYVDKCKAALNLNRSTATMEEIKEFMHKIPQTKSLTGSVTKHATVTSYLSLVIKNRDLLQVSLLEQDMVASSNQSDHWTRLQAFAARGDIDPRDLARLCLIFHMRYESGGQVSRAASLLDKVSTEYALLLRAIREYYGVTRSTEGLFGATGVMASIVKTFVDVGNIYTQHEPVLKRTLLQLYSGRLDAEQYPYLAAPPAANTAGSPAVFKPQEAIVFMCGGYTYEEAALVHAINTKTAYKPSEVSSFHPSGVRASLGGEATLNSSRFMEQLAFNM